MSRIRVYCPRLFHVLIGLFCAGRLLAAEPTTATDGSASGDTATTASTVAAPSASPFATLDDTVVVATSHERELVSAPYIAYLLDDDDLKLRLQPKSLPDSLKDTPGVLMQKTAHGMTSPFLRGVTGQRVVLIADGMRLNNSYLRDGPNEYWMLVDGYFYDNLEVLMGPSSVLYGSDAIGGVVRARSTPTPRGDAGSGATWQGGEVDFRWSSAEASFSEHVEGAVALDDRWTLKLGLTRRDFGELTTGDGVENPGTEYEEWGGNARLTYWFDEDHTLTVGYDHFDRDNVNRVHRTVDHQDFHGTRTKRPGDITDLSRTYDYDEHAAFATYAMRDGGGFLEEMDLTLSYQSMQEQYDRRRTTIRHDYRDNLIETLGVALRLQSPSEWGTWTYGADWYHDWTTTRAINQNNAGVAVGSPAQGSVANDATYDLAGIYVQNELPLGERFELISGLRFTYAALDAQDVTGIPDGVSGDWTALTGSLRLLYRALPNDRLNLFAGVSQGFHAPNLSDATRDDEFGGGTEKPTADLDAEYYTTFELGAKTRGDWGHLQVVAYHTEIEDQIGRFDLPTASKRNMENGYIHGIEADAALKLAEEWEVFGRIAWQEGRQDSYNNRDVTQEVVTRPVSRMMPLNGQIGVRFTPSDLPIFVETYVDWSDEQTRLADNEIADNRFPTGGTPGYAVLGVRGGWTIRKNLDLVVTAENLTDESYRVHGSGINENGRGVIASLRARF